MKRQRNIIGWYTVAISSLVGCTMASFVSQFSMTVNQLSIKLGVSQEILLFSDVLKSLTIVLGMLSSGIIYEKLHLKKTFILAVAFLLIPQFIMPYSPNIQVLIVLKLIQGFSTVIFPILILNIIDWIDKEQTGFATAVFNGLFYGGSGIGAVISGYIIPKMSWEASYIVLGIISLIFSIIWLLTVHEKPKNISNRILEDNIKTHTTYLDMICMPETWLLIIGLLGSTWSIQAVAADMPIFGEYIGYSVEDIGKIMASTAIGTIIASLVSGKASDYYALNKINKSASRVKIMMLSSMITLISSLLLITLDLKNFNLFYALVLLLSFGGAWGLGSFYSILPELFSDEMMKIAPGFSGGIADISVPLSPFIVGIVFGSRGKWGLAWMSCSIMSMLSLLACVILLIRIKNKKKHIATIS